MADDEYIRHSAATAVRPPVQEPVLREGWGSPGATDRPARLLQHAQTDDTDVAVRPLAAALGAVALVLIAAALMVVAFAF